MSGLKAKAGDLIRTAARYLEPLWPSGLALLCLLLGALLWKSVLGLQGEGLEWAIYLTLGTIFPALLLVLSFSKRFTSEDSRPALSAKLSLSLLVLLVSAVFVVKQHQYTAFALSIAHLVLIIISLRRTGRQITPAAILIIFFVVVTAWTVSARLLWWSSFGVWFFDTNSTAEIIYRFLISLLSILLVFINLNQQERRDEGAGFQFRSFANIAAILLIALASVRSDQLFHAMSHSHWGVVVGPAEMVRQGGWLLWDVPSQYGFLNILLVALFPVESVWQATYILNSLLLFASALFLFFLLRSAQAGVANFFFSLAVTLAAVFLIAGWPPALLGPQVFPSLGPFRFIWCYVLLFILFLDFRRPAAKGGWQLPLAGCCAWLIGTLWSSESAVYCAAIWLPCYALIILRKARGLRMEGKSAPKRARKILLWAMIPPLLLASAVGVITVYYLIGLGHGPDWLAFYEYSLAFTGGFLTIPIDVHGPVWVIFLVFCALSTMAASLLLQRDRLRHRALILMTGTWGALWSISSYFISRSHPNNATVLSPMLCIAIGVMLYLFVVCQWPDWWARLIRMSFVPVLAILLTVTFGNASFLGLYLSSPKLGYERDITSHLPVLDPSLLELLNTAQVKRSDPLIYSAIRVRAVEPQADRLKHDGGVMPPAWPVGDGRFFASYKTWLPTMPFVLFDPLPAARKQVYMDRFTSRTRLSGWLIQNKHEAPYTSSAWFYNQITRTHTPVRMFENNNWQVIWFELKPSGHE
jgi:hypothetical protein